MAFTDSFDKIITYCAAVCTEPFIYKDKKYIPKKLVINSSIFRGYSCVSKCAGCCLRFSLDYIPEENLNKVPNLQERFITISSKKFVILSDMQKQGGHHCQYVSDEGLCAIHGSQPFSCDFELLRFSHFTNLNRLSTRLYGRGWAMLKIDNKRGALCLIKPITEDSIQDVIRKIRRLQQWCDYLEIPNKCSALLTSIESYQKNAILPQYALNKFYIEL